jgi:hypothetical protein
VTEALTRTLWRPTVNARRRSGDRAPAELLACRRSPDRGGELTEALTRTRWRPAVDTGQGQPPSLRCGGASQRPPPSIADLRSMPGAGQETMRQQRPTYLTISKDMVTHPICHSPSILNPYGKHGIELLARRRSPDRGDDVTEALTRTLWRPTVNARRRSGDLAPASTSKAFILSHTSLAARENREEQIERYLVL